MRETDDRNGAVTDDERAERRERIAWGVLHALKLPPSRAADVVLAGGAAHVLARGREGAFGVDEARARAVDRRAVARALARLVDEGGHILGGARRDELGGIGRAPSPPLVVYARGNPALLVARPAVAIVGTRHPTREGDALARALAKDLAARGVHVVSGGAIGVDLAAHAGALARGTTTAVLGEALTQSGDPRRERIRALFVDDDRALAVTPYGPSLGDLRGHFASRNRFIAALADAVVVIEAGLHSGTLHTVAGAARLGVPVFAVADGDGLPERAGNRALLDEGDALPLGDVDALAALASRRAASDDGEPVTPRQTPRAFARHLRDRAHAARPARRRGGTTLALPFVDDGISAGDVAAASPRARDDDPILSALARAGGRMERDALVRALALDVSALTERLTLLELDGHVRREGALVVLRA